MFSKTLFVVFLVVLSVSSVFAGVITPYGPCSVYVSGDLGEPQPLLIKPGTTSLVHPQTSSGYITFVQGEQVELYCSSTGFEAPFSGNTIFATCVDGQQFSTSSGTYTFNQFVCKAFPWHTARKTGERCYNNGFIIEMGFEVGSSSRFIKTFEVCHDEVREENYYAHHLLTPSSHGYQRSFPRPSFITGGFFGGKNVDSIYTRYNQRLAIAEIVGSYDLALQYIEETSDVFLSRGHLAAKVDLIFGTEQRSTFYFMNAAPQFQTFNGLNWNEAEYSIRKLASDREMYLDCFTGTFGTLKLLDVNGIPQEIYLYVDGNTRQIPVPMLYYRIVINHADNSGVVLLGVNNPHATLAEIQKDYIICPDISMLLTYMTWRKDDLGWGYSYACDVNEFLKVVHHVSGINVSRLLV